MKYRLLSAVPAWIAVIAVMLGSPPDGVAGPDPRWDDRFGFPGVNGEVRAAVLYRGDLVIGGTFTEAGGVPAAKLARWDGRTWSGLGNGVSTSGTFPGEVNALAVDGDALVVGGFFTRADTLNASNIARWDGTRWTGFGTGVGSTVHALVAEGGSVWAAGEFKTAGTISARRVARWDGTAWSAFGAGIGTVNNDASVYAITRIGDGLVVTGDFVKAGGDTADNVARWNGSSWEPMAGGTDGIVRSVIVHENTVYIGGEFERAGNASVLHVARWTGVTWAGVGNGTGDDVFVLSSEPEGLLAGGIFGTAGGVDAAGVALWDGSAWSPIGAGVLGRVRAVAGSGDARFFAGTFVSAGGGTAHNVVEFSESTWRSLGLGIPGEVLTLVQGPGGIYAGGEFLHAGWTRVTRIALWDGSAWSALEGGIDGPVSALATHGELLYAGGLFTMAGNTEVSNIARWNGDTWEPLGDGLNGRCLALAVDADGNVYAGGSFSAAGQATASRIAMWDGDRWRTLGAGIPAPFIVNALALDGTTLYAGGRFEIAGGVAAANIARWAAGAWGPVAGGVDGEVFDLDVTGSRVAVVGDFIAAGGAEANGVAVFDGVSWETGIGSGLGLRPIRAVEARGESLYVGGSFEVVGGIAARGVALWDGGLWHALGDGAIGTVNALAFDGASLYLGGLFTRTGGGTGWNFGRWDTGVVPVRLSALRAERAENGVTVSWRISGDVADAAGFRVHRETPDGVRTALDGWHAGRVTYSVLDRAAPRVPLRYRVEEVSRTGGVVWHGPVSVDGGIATARLTAARPNPFSASASVRYRLETAGPAEVVVFDVRGRVVRRLVSGHQPAGDHEAVWDGRDDLGRERAPGLYLIRLVSREGTAIRKLVRVP